MDSLIVIMFISALVIGGGLLLVIGMSRRGNKALNKEQYQREWLEIQGSVGSDAQSQQFAIFRADKLLDKALRESGYSGETMGERMSSAKQVFSRREAVWVAHKLRNRIAHEDSVTINSRLTKKALDSFKKALQDMGAI